MLVEFQKAFFSLARKGSFILLYNFDGDVASGILYAVYRVEFFEGFIHVSAFNHYEGVFVSSDSEGSGDGEFADFLVNFDAFDG